MQRVKRWAVGAVAAVLLAVVATIRWKFACPACDGQGHYLGLECEVCEGMGM